jgi:hypothetical protein
MSVFPVIFAVATLNLLYWSYTYSPLHVIFAFGIWLEKPLLLKILKSFQDTISIIYLKSIIFDQKRRILSSCLIFLGVNCADWIELHYILGILGYMVLRRPLWKKNCTHSGCTELSAILQMLDSFFSQHCPTSTKDIHLSTNLRFHFFTSSKHIHFFLAFGVPFTFREADFHQMQGRETLSKCTAF